MNKYLAMKLLTLFGELMLWLNTTFDTPKTDLSSAVNMHHPDINSIRT